MTPGQGQHVATPKNYSVMKAFAILKAFHDPAEWVTSNELSRRANLPEASGYRLIQTLEDIGALVRGPRGRYRPGLLLLSLSHNVTINDLLRDASQALMSELARRLQLTTHLGVLEQGMVTYVAKVSVPGAFAVHTRVGAQLEAYCSGLGKVLLAALPEQEVDSFVLDGELIALTPHTITTKAGLRAELKKVRERGYAMDDREHQADMRCIAVPVHGPRGPRGGSAVGHRCRGPHDGGAADGGAGRPEGSGSGLGAKTLSRLQAAPQPPPYCCGITVKRSALTRGPKRPDRLQWCRRRR